MSIVQDLSQLRARYGGERANSILNNHACKVVLSGLSDPDTADVITRLAGHDRLVDVQLSRGPDGRLSRTYSLRDEPMATVDTLRQLPRDAALVVYRDRPPALVRLRPWFRSRRLRAMRMRRFFSRADYAGRKR
jgi:type IV secretory pathway TraG/TraD family ATPase VirD4